MNFVVVVYLFLQIALSSTSIPRRDAVRQELTIYKLSLHKHLLDPYFNEEVTRRRLRRQITVDSSPFPSDDEDSSPPAGSGGSDEVIADFDLTVDPTISPTTSARDPEPSATDWVWLRARINFLDSIVYSDDLKSYRSQRFQTLAHAITTSIEEFLSKQLHGYVEVIPLTFSSLGSDVYVAFDIGLCAKNSMDHVRQAVAAMVSGGRIGTSGEYRVSQEPPTVLRLGVEKNRQECVPGPTMRPTAPAPTSQSNVIFDPKPRVQPVASSTRSIVVRAPSCRFDQATCQNLECIDRSYVCDRSRDCSDGSDEPASCGVRTECDPTEFLCVGTNVCAQKIWRCDGEDDCGNGYDELNCPQASPGSSCAPNQFQCRNQACVPSSHQCDGEYDCNDRSDEMGCSAPVVIVPPLRRLTVFVGDVVTMHCEAAGTPTPVISWRVNWGNLPPPPRVTMTSENGFGTLTIRDVEKGDQGAYTCEAMNSIDAILATPDAILIVDERPISPTTEPAGCKPGFFNIAPPGDEAICKPCFCFGLTNQCHTSKYEFSEIGIGFSKPSEDHQGVILDFNDTIEGSPDAKQPITKNQIRINPPARELQLIDLSKRFLAAAHYWSLPAQFLGAKINSYGGTLTFSYSYNTSAHGIREPVNDPDVILEGNGRRLLYSQPPPHPEAKVKHKAKVLLSEEDNWKNPDGTDATREDLIVVLEDLDKVLLRTVYDNSMISSGIGEIKLQVARPREEGSGAMAAAAPPDDVMAYSVEECQCPEGYAGLSCETCDVGYERVGAGPLLGRCVFNDEQKGPPSVVICNEGYTGDDCSQCAEGFTHYEGGCTRYPDTYCSVAGSIGVNADRTCECKEGCEGASCDRCKPGFYHMSEANPQGCLPCFCMNVSDECYSTQWNISKISPSFQFDQVFLLKNANSGLVFEDGISVGSSQGGASEQFVTAPLHRFPDGVYYWMLPKEFTGNKLGSYGGSLNYSISYNESVGAFPMTNFADVIVTGNEVTIEYFGENHPAANIDTRFQIVFNEANWRTDSGEPVTRADLLFVLSNIEHLLIRATYSDKMKTSSIKDISLATAVPEYTGGARALQVEECVCPPGYTGLSCEECADGFYREISGEYLGRCVPCDCNQHSNMCDKQTGICLNCLHNTEGNQCSRCMDGYYGDPRTGEPDACQLCPCPDVDGEGSGFLPLCSMDCEGRPVCTLCPVGFKGKTCQECADGYVVDPTDPNNCVMNEGIQDCRCDVNGATSPACDNNERCDCKASTMGDKCSECRPGYFFLSEENPDGGCLPCFCMGITNRCDSASMKRNQIVANFTDDYGGFRLTQQSCLTHVTEGYQVLDNGLTLSYPNLDQLSRDKPYFWQLPDEYRGDKIVSYGGKLEYKASYTTVAGSTGLTSDPDVILVGNGIMLTSRMTGLGSEVRPNEVMERYVIFRENYWEDINGNPATREQLLMVLADIDSILIRATYDESTRRTTISHVAMDTASDIQLGTEPAYEVEQCQCPPGYRGTSCQTCAPGFRRVDGGLYLGFCLQCQCNGHSNRCDRISGNCLNCQGNTAGDSCQNCAPGHYRRPFADVTDQCFPCACPGTGGNNFADSCYVDSRSSTLQCRGCQRGYTGRNCGRCEPGFVGNPTIPGGRCLSGTAPQVCVTPNKVKVRLGGSATLRCTVRSNSSVNVMWRRAGSNPGPLPARASVLEEGRVLRFHFFTESQVGTYECVATNMFGTNSDSAVLTLSPGQVPIISVRIKEPNNVTVKEGAQVSFVCTANSQVPAYVISWTKQNSMLPTTRASDFEGVLNIRSVQISDTGVYICTGSNMYDTDRAVAYLRVVPAIQPELPSAVVTPERQQVSEGDEVMFYCTARGHPTPSIEWRRADGQPLPNEARVVGSMLMIPAASVDDGSVYSCTASNSYGEVEARGALEVTVRGAPPVVTVLTPDVRVTVGDSVDLRCSAQGVPTPQFTWTKRNQVLPSNAVRMGSTLRLSSVTYDNQGFYLCTARNQFGSDFGYVRVSVRRRAPSRPVCRTDPKQVTAYVGTNSSINCVVGGNPPPNVYWETENGAPLDDNIRVLGTRMYIENVRLTNAGNYICVAVNSQGESRSKMMLRVVKKDLPTLNISPLPYLRIKAGLSAYFICLAPGQSDVTVTWIRSNGQSFTGNTYLSNGGSKLNFGNISKIEEGNYLCVGTNGAGRRTSRVRVSVMEPPTLTVTPGYNVEVREGEELSMTCAASGDPRPSVVWLKSSRPGQSTMLTNYRQRSVSYSVENVVASDAGIYICRAINQAGTIQREVAVTVTGNEQAFSAPIVTVESAFARKFVGDDAQLNCFVSGNPQPSVRWSKRNGQMSSGSEQVGDSLHMRDLRAEDTGTYECAATNAAGTRTDTVYLQVVGAPVVQATPNDVTKMEGDSVTFDCVVVANGNQFDILLRWQKADGSSIDSSRSTIRNGKLIINNLMRSDAGQYTCSATNGAGTETATVSLSVTGRNEEPQVERSTVMTRSGEELRLSCMLDDSLTVDNVQWTKQDGSIRAGDQTGTDYVINPVDIADAGLYVCDVEYASGLAAKTMVTVHVNGFLPYFTQTPLSYVSIPIPDKHFYSTFNISISFRPNIFDGLLFYTYGPNRDFASLSLNNGYVEFRYELGSGTATIRSWNPVLLGQWNTVLVSRSVFKGELHLNDDPVQRGRSPGEFRALDVNSNLYVGGVPDSIGLPSSLQYLGRDPGFYGCISHLNIGNGMIDFGSPDQTSEMIGIVRCRTCGSHDEDTPCENEGVCIETYFTEAGFMCDCKDGFSGDTCATAEPSNRTDDLYERSARAAKRKTTKEPKNQAIRFESESYVRGQRQYKYLPFRTDIEMKIRFDSFADGKIFSTEPYSVTPTTPPFYLGFHSGSLEFRFKYNQGQHIIRAPVSSHLVAQNWYSVVAVRRRGYIALIINGNVVARKSFADTGAVDIQLPIFLGAGAAAPLDGFVGCLKELKMDDKPVDFSSLFLKHKTEVCNGQFSNVLVGQRIPEYSRSFSGESYISFPKKVFRHKTNTEQIALTFRTSQPNGVVLLQSQGPKRKNSQLTSKKNQPQSNNLDFILLEVKNSRLVFSFHMNGNSGVATSDILVTNNLWYNVVITRRGSLALMWIDEDKPDVAQPSGTMPNLPDLKGRLNLGGVPRGLKKGFDLEGFDGCILGVRLISAKTTKLTINEPLDDSDADRLDISDPRLAKSHNTSVCNN